MFTTVPVSINRNSCLATAFSMHPGMHTFPCDMKKIMKTRNMEHSTLFTKLIDLLHSKKMFHFSMHVTWSSVQKTHSFPPSRLQQAKPSGQALWDLQLSIWFPERTYVACARAIYNLKENRISYLVRIRWMKFVTYNSNNIL